MKKIKNKNWHKNIMYIFLQMDVKQHETHCKLLIHIGLVLAIEMHLRLFLNQLLRIGVGRFDQLVAHIT